MPNDFYGEFVAHLRGDVSGEAGGFVIFSLVRSVSRANHSYDAPNSALDIQYFFQSNQLGLLFIPMYLDAEPGFAGGALKPIMKNQINDILGRSGASVISRRIGEHSEPFPPKNRAWSPPAK